MWGPQEGQVWAQELLAGGGPWKCVEMSPPELLCPSGLAAPCLALLTHISSFTF